MDGRAEPVSGSRPFEVTHRLVLSIAVPMTLGLLTTPLLGLTDTAVVGRLGQAEALAGLAIGAILFDLIYGSLSFFRTSTTGLAAQAFGRDDLREQQAVFLRAALSALGLGLLMLLLGPLLLRVAPELMTQDRAVAEVVRSYFAIRVLSSPATFVNYAVLGFVFGRGQAMLGLILQILLNGTNILLSIYLGLGLGWGIAGVAWGTAAAELLAAIVGTVVVMRQLSAVSRPSWAELVDPAKLKQLFQLNADILIRSLVLNAAFALMTRVGSSFGAVTLAANAVLMNVFMLSAFFLDGLAGAAEQLSGRAVGANYRPSFERALKLTAGWSFAMAGLLGLFFIALGIPVIELLTTSSEVREAAATYLPWAAITGLTGALAFQMDGVFIGATWSREMRNMMLLSFAAYCATLAALVPTLGNHGLWIGLNLFLLMRGLLLLALVPRKSAQSFVSAH
ncbi:putative MATE family efflux protein [Pseudorhizobium tarimense]|uniref:MATE family efflux protein n=1 Tax=Pseudorhizobium tarimense TaxID=1079109 RepID=A0ABV2HDM5_9HYPH|nr:MATE family efflux transporter [Pseudorhizobium tarimense]MCJ8521664.1 MATE family efflux transporter [Pseudorhizobium tarimense]